LRRDSLWISLLRLSRIVSENEHLPDPVLHSPALAFPNEPFGAVSYLLRQENDVALPRSLATTRPRCDAPRAGGRHAGTRLSKFVSSLA
jgi:hypothetical protein